MRGHFRTKTVAAFTMLFVSVVAAQAQGYGAFTPGLFGFALSESTKISLDVGAAITGFLIGAFFSPLLAPFRRIAFFAALALAVFYAWTVHSAGADFASILIAIFVFSAAFGYGIRLGLTALLRRRYAAERPTSFGSAKWATAAYLEDRKLFGDQGFILGEFVENGRRYPLAYTGMRHLLTVAPTRSGKGVSSIIPNLLSYPGSALVIDPKGENALITAIRRGGGDAARAIPGLGQAIKLVDPWNIAAGALGIRSARFNPLDWIKPGDPDASENAFLLADALVPDEGSGEAKFWDAESKSLLTGLILYVATSKNEGGQRHLGRVRDILIMSDPDFKKQLEAMFAESNPIVASTAARTADKDVKLRSSVLAAAQSHTHFLDSPRIRESLSASDFRFEDLKTSPMTVYLILPADRLQTFDRWMRLLIQQAITINARNIAVKPTRPVLFLLDEMPALGRLAMVEQAYGLMAGFGMQLWGIVQDLSQLERIYYKSWQTFISNAGVIQYFGSRDKMTAEYFSTLCGVTTIRISSISYALGRAFGSSRGSSSGAGGGSSSSGTNESTSHTHTIGTNESQRQLAYPDELMVLREDNQIIFVENFDPITAVKVRWYESAKLKALGFNLHTATTSDAAAPKPVEPAKPTATQPPSATPEPVRKLTIPSQRYGNVEAELYSDGSIEVETTTGPYRFASLDAFKAFIEQPQE